MDFIPQASLIYNSTQWFVFRGSCVILIADYVQPRTLTLEKQLFLCVRRDWQNEVNVHPMFYIQKCCGHQNSLISLEHFSITAGHVWKILSDTEYHNQ